MKHKQEGQEVARIRAKIIRGEKLTPREWRIFAYSPYGTGGGCPSTQIKPY